MLSPARFRALLVLHIWFSTEKEKNKLKRTEKRSHCSVENRALRIRTTEIDIASSKPLGLHITVVMVTKL